MNRFSHSSLGVAVACATLLFVGCGGGDMTEAEAEAREEAQKQPITIQSFGPNVISIWDEIAVKTAGNVAGPRPGDHAAGDVRRGDGHRRHAQAVCGHARDLGRRRRRRWR